MSLVASDVYTLRAIVLLSPVHEALVVLVAG